MYFYQSIPVHMKHLYHLVAMVFDLLHGGTVQCLSKGREVSSYKLLQASSECVSHMQVDIHARLEHWYAAQALKLRSIIFTTLRVRVHRAMTIARHETSCNE